MIVYTAVRTRPEYDVLTCAQESFGILPYLVEHYRPDGRYPARDEVAAAVLACVERGWVEMHRPEAWTSPEGESGLQYSEPLDHAEIPAVLADEDTWDDPTADAWVGEVTLSPTPAWSESVAGRRYGPMSTWQTHPSR